MMQEKTQLQYSENIAEGVKLTTTKPQTQASLCYLGSSWLIRQPPPGVSLGNNRDSKIRYGNILANVIMKPDLF